MAAVIHMPVRGERAAPMFDITKPQELPKYFDEIEYLFSRAAISDETTKKCHVLRYVNFEIERLWKAIPEFKNPTSSYADFKKAILYYYPEASDDSLYSLADINLLIDKHQRTGISSTAELSSYHLQFVAITSWLIDNYQLSALEQQRAYIRAFQPHLLAAITNRLQVKKPDHHPNIPHPIEDIYDATQYILRKATASTHIHYNSIAPIISPAMLSTDSPKNVKFVEKEDLSEILLQVKQSIAEALNISRSSYTAHSIRPSNAFHCLMCGLPHSINKCETVTEYIRAEKCKRNFEGKVVLPSGNFVPRDIPGRLLMDRIDKWHQNHPNQLPASSTVHTINQRQSIPPATNPYQKSTQNESITYKPSPSDRIAALEAEIVKLKAKQVAMVHSTVQKPKNEEADESKAENVSITLASQPQPNSRIPAADSADSAILTQKRVSTQHLSASQPKSTDEYIYPSGYQPPTLRNLCAPPKAPVGKKHADLLSHITQPCIYNFKTAADVSQQLMEVPMTINQGESFAVAPASRSQLQDSIQDNLTADSAAPAAPAIQHTFQSNLEDNSYNDNPLPFAIFTAEKSSRSVLSPSPVDLSSHIDPKTIAEAPEPVPDFKSHCFDESNLYNRGILSSQFPIAKINQSAIANGRSARKRLPIDISNRLMNFQPKPMRNNSEKWRIALDINFPEDIIAFNPLSYISKISHFGRFSVVNYNIRKTLNKSLSTMEAKYGFI